MYKYLIILATILLGLTSCAGTYKVATTEPVYVYRYYYHPQPLVRYYPIVVHSHRVTPRPSKPSIPRRDTHRPHLSRR